MLKDNEILKILSDLNEMFPDAKCELVYHNIFELSIATILSAQTTDKSVNKITPLLFSKYPNVYELAKANQQDVIEIIKPIGLSRNKSKNIILFSKKVVSQYNGIIPNDFILLTTLPGVGRKTANVILVEGYKIPRFPVDTHIERVSKRLGIVSANSSVLDIELELMNLIPKEMWHKAHHLFLFFGRYFCFAKKPMCDKCIFKNQCKFFND